MCKRQHFYLNGEVNVMPMPMPIFPNGPPEVFFLPIVTEVVIERCYRLWGLLEIWKNDSKL